MAVPSLDLVAAPLDPTASASAYTRDLLELLRLVLGALGGGAALGGARRRPAAAAAAGPGAAAAAAGQLAELMAALATPPGREGVPGVCAGAHGSAHFGVEGYEMRAVLRTFPVQAAGREVTAQRSHP